MTEYFSLIVIARNEVTKLSFQWYMKLFKKCLAEFISASKVTSTKRLWNKLRVTK